MKFIKNLWCQKVLPLVYDNSLSYYEVLCKLKAKINEIIEWINNHSDGDTFVTKADGTDLVNETYVDVYGRNYYNGYSGQGMCIISINGYDYVVQCMIKDNSNQHIIIRNFETGEIWVEKDFTELGHANSVCTDGECIYVATSGGGSTVYNVVKLDYELNVLSTYSLGENISPYGIAYNKGKFYILGANNACWVTKDFINFDDTLFVPKRENVIAQGFVADDNYLYIPRGNWYSNFNQNKSCVNLIDVCDHDMNFIKTIYVMCYTEIEEFEFLKDGSVLFASNTASSAVYLRGNIYPTTVNIKSDNNRYTNGYVTNQFTVQYYVDENTTNFRQDGSLEYPLSSIYMISNCASFYVTGLEIIMLSDITAPNLGYSGSLINVLKIVGNGHTLKTNLSIRNGVMINLDNVVIKNNGTYAIDALFAKSCYINNCTVDLTNNTGGIRMQGTLLQTENIKFINCGNKVVMYCINGGGVRVFKGLTDDGGYYNITNNFYTTNDDCTPHLNHLFKVGCGNSVLRLCDGLMNLDNTKWTSIDEICVPAVYNVTGFGGMPNDYDGHTLEITRLSNNGLIAKLYDTTLNGYYMRVIRVAESEIPTAFGEWKYYSVG